MRASHFLVFVLGFASNLDSASASNLDTEVHVSQVFTLDTPVETLKITPGKSPSGETLKTTLSCFVYPDFAVLEVDEGEVGAKDISIRRRPSGMRTWDLCKRDYSGKSFSIKGVTGHFEGVCRGYVFERSADNFGVLTGINVYDSANGERIFETEFNSRDHAFIIEKKIGRVAITYYRPLRLSCVPSKENKDCWKQILKENQVPGNILEPRCENALKLAPDAFSDPNRSLQITVGVRVNDLSKPKVTYLGGDSTCDPSP